MFKGVLKDDVTLREAKVAKGSKLMMLATVVASAEALAATKSPASDDGRSSDRPHRRDRRLVVFEPMQEAGASCQNSRQGQAGRRCCPAMLCARTALPVQPASRRLMTAIAVSKCDSPSRAYRADRSSISSSENTQRIALRRDFAKSRLRRCVTTKDYSIVNLVMGSGTVADSANYFLYWVPTNFVNAIKDEILGKFM
jgi:hypothetical protein